jgi:hypothetical protein
MEPDDRLHGSSGSTAYDRTVGAFGVIPRQMEMPVPVRPGLIVIIGEKSDQKEAATAKPMDRPIWRSSVV